MGFSNKFDVLLIKLAFIPSSFWSVGHRSCNLCQVLGNIVFEEAKTLNSAIIVPYLYSLSVKQCGTL